MRYIIYAIISIAAFISCGKTPLHPLQPDFAVFSCDFETGYYGDYRWTDYSLAGDHSLLTRYGDEYRLR